MSRTFGGAGGGPDMVRILPVPAAAATYTAGQVLVWVAASDWYAASTTTLPGAKVVAHDQIVLVDGDPIDIVQWGEAFIKFTAACEQGVEVYPSASSAGIGTGYAVVNLNATFSDTEVEGEFLLRSKIFAHTMEVVSGSSLYYKVWVN